MADPLFPMTLGVGASLVKVLLQANGYATEANLVGVAKEVCCILSWWKIRGGDADDQLAKQIAEVLADKTRGMYEECRDQGIDEEQLGGVVTEVEIIFNKVVGNDELLFLAVNDPDSFSEVLQGDIGQRRKNIESRLEPYFDKLVEAAVDEYVKLAPWSPKFQIEALKDLTNKVEEILKNTAKGSVIFGRRPDIADSYYIEREEQVRLYNLVKKDPRLRLVLVGMHGCGKSQLVSDFAQGCEKQGWSLVAWINAASRESVQSDLAELAQRLPIDRSDEPTQDQLINRCLDYFKSANATDRLIVFDNVEDINDLTGLVPRGDGLRVVATTTNEYGWKNQSWDQIKIGVFSREDSIEFYEQMLAEREWVLGPDHPYTLTARNNLAGAYKSAGRFGEAIELYEQVLAEYERVLGADHPDMLIRNNLAVAYLSVGRFGEAIELFEQVLAEYEWVLGSDHPDTLTVRNNLAGAYDSAGRLAEAIDAWKELLPDCQRILGADHPDTLAVRNNLAVAYYSVGRFGEAVELFEQVLAERKRLLGSDHPDTLNTRNNLAVAYDSVGRFAEAVDAWEELLPDCQRVLGADHPDTLAVRNNLAHAYDSVGRFGEAIELFERVLAEQERVLGPDHPDTLVARNNLAGAYDSAGRFGEAIELYERVLGPDHPDTLTTRHNLAFAYHSAGHFDEAIELYERVLADRVRVLGPDHPDTLTTRNNLAVAYHSVGRFGEAIELFERVLADRVRVLGPDHPDTLNARDNLALAYDSAGHLAEAIDAWEELLPDCQRVLGLEHPLTKQVEKNLEAAKREMNPPDAPSPETGED